MVNIKIWLKAYDQIKFLRYRAFEIASNPKYDRHQKRLASTVYKFFDKKSASLAGSGINSISNQQLADEFHKPIIRKFKRGKVYSSFKDNIWGAGLGDMQLISKYNKKIRFLLCVIDIFSKYARVVPLKDKNGVTIVNALKDKKEVTIVNVFQNIWDISKRNQIKYGLIKAVNFIIIILKNG